MVEERDVRHTFVPDLGDDDHELIDTTMQLPGSRVLNLAGFLACVGMMAYALYAEHYLLLEPCPLCIFQRMATIGTGLIFLIAAVHHPSGLGRRIYAVLIASSAAIGVGVAGRHVWLQNLPADQVPACGPGFGYIIDAFPLSEALRLIFTGSGECASIDWSFLGLSMPAWVVICFVVLAVYGVWANWRRSDGPVGNESLAQLT